MTVAMRFGDSLSNVVYTAQICIIRLHRAEIALKLC